MAQGSIQPLERARVTIRGEVFSMCFQETGRDADSHCHLGCQIFVISSV
jgi:hypothetical protein